MNQSVRVKSLSCVQLFASPSTVAHQTPLSMEFSMQEYWSGLTFHPPRDLPDPGIKPRSLALQADSLPSESQDYRYFRASVSSVAQSCPTLCDSPWNSPDQNTGVGSLSLLQGIFLTQGLNPGLMHCRWIHYQLSHKGSPRILEWVAYPFSSGYSRPRNQTRVSCIAGRFFTS